MKKGSSLAEQIQAARREVDSWSDDRKSSLRLEGSDIFLNRFSSNKTCQHQSETSTAKKKGQA